MSSAAMPLEMQGFYAPPQRIVIASIYPMDVVTKIARRAPVNTFKIPAGKREKDGKWVPGYVVVEDTWESSSTSKGGNVRILAEHTALHIVNDQTVHLFRCNASERAWPGIFQCAGIAATAEEISDAEGCQQRYWTLLVNAARELARKEKVAEVQDDMRMAGRELGIVGESWQREISRDQQKKCVWCLEFIDKMARLCGKCNGFQSDADAHAFAAQNAPPPRQALQPPVQASK